MKFQLKCTECGELCWASGEVDESTNAAEVSDLPDEACVHIWHGGEFEIVDEEFSDD